MPVRPRKPCAEQGCPELVDPGEKYCQKHKALHPDPVRSGSSRGYNRDWQRISKQYLASHPLCVKCMERGKYTKATVVDHITPHRGNKKLFWDPENWQALCKPCHDRKTGEEDRVVTYAYRERGGGPENL